MDPEYLKRLDRVGTYLLGAAFDTIPAFDGFRLVWRGPDGSLIHLDDELGRSMIFSDTGTARRLAEQAERATQDIITKIRGK